MKILCFRQHFSTPKGTVGIRPYEMAKLAIENGHEITIVCGSFDGAETGLNTKFLNGKRTGIVDGIRIIEFDLAYSNSDGYFKRSLTFIKYAFRSIGLTFSEQYDVVFASTTPLTAGIPGIFARWFRNKPFVFEVRDLWPELPKQMGVIKNPIILNLMSLLEWLSYHSAQRCIALSPGIVEGIENRGIKKDKIMLVPNGCDLEIFSENTTTWRPDGVLNSDLMAVYCGTHGLANGLDAALDAAIELQVIGRDDIKIVLIGKGKLKAKLQERAEREGIKNVVFHAPVDKSQLAGLLASADIGLQLLSNVPAFYFGTSPNKFFDYIAAGLPVLNNYPGWVAEMIENNQCGFTVEPDSSRAFAGALVQAADDRQLLSVMGHKSLKLAQNDFDRKLLADRWVDWVTGVKS